MKHTLRTAVVMLALASGIASRPAWTRIWRAGWRRPMRTRRYRSSSS